MSKHTPRRRRYAPTSPVARALATSRLKAEIAADLARWRTMAELQAWAGNHQAELVNSTGRLIYIVLHAVAATGMDQEHPDVRIVLGTGEALGDLVADGRLEHHRGSIQSGLAAVERLLERCDLMHIAFAAQEMETLLASADMGTASLHSLFKPEQAPLP